MLIVVLAMHVQCGASCFAEAFGAKAVQQATNPSNNEPPCHKHSGDPAPTPPISHETTNSCDRGSIVESKVRVIGKHILMPITAIVQPVAALVLFDPGFMAKTAEDTPAEIWSPPLRSVILRI
jgi:hypothetical protein